MNQRTYFTAIWCLVFLIFSVHSVVQIQRLPVGAAPALPSAHRPQQVLPSTIRLGLFNLFHSRTLTLSPTSVAFSLECDGVPRRMLQPGKRYRVLVRGEQIRLLSDTDDETAEPIAEGQHLQLRAVPSKNTDEQTASPCEMELEVVGRRTHLVRRVRGELAFSVYNAELQTVLTQNTEDAVAIITASEMIGYALPEALKSQAIVVRSYLLSHLGRHRAAGYDLCDNTHCQLYFGEPPPLPQSERLFRLASDATQVTRGETLWSEGQPVEAYFTACCGGHTTTPEIAWGGDSQNSSSVHNEQSKENSSFPSALSTQKSKIENRKSETVACFWCRNARFYRWQRVTERSVLLEALSSVWGAKLTDGVSVQVTNRSRLGFVTELALSDGHRQVTLSNAQFRGLVGRSLGWNTVLSNVYTLEHHGDRYIFRGNGFGHQVGLCVEGSVAQARVGRNYRDILKFYFPHASVVQADR